VFRNAPIDNVIKNIIELEFVIISRGIGEMSAR